jgi:hypothetical protein
MVPYLYYLAESPSVWTGNTDLKIVIARISRPIVAKVPPIPTRVIVRPKDQLSMFPSVHLTDYNSDPRGNDLPLDRSDYPKKRDK